jgi:hypothetical protein
VAASRLKKFIFQGTSPETSYDPRHRDEGILEQIYGPVQGGAHTHPEVLYPGIERGALEEEDTDSELEDQIMTRQERQRREEDIIREENRAYIPAGAKLAVVIGPRRGE